MVLKELKDLRKRINNINKDKLGVTENMESLIEEKRKEINDLEAQINEIEKRKNQEIQFFDDEEKKVLTEYENKLEEIDIYGTYTIYSLIPILADITKKMEKEDVYFRTYSYMQSAITYINACKVYYNFDVLVLNGKNFQFVVAESPKPKEIVRMGFGEGYANKTFFSKDHKFATYDCEKESFDFVTFGSYIIHETPLYIKDFIIYVSNYRLEHDLKEININELKELEDKFLEENKDKYKESVRNLKK